MFKIAVIFCLIGGADTDCHSFESPPMFTTFDQCAAYMKSPQFQINDVKALSQQAANALKKAGSFKWEGGCYPAVDTGKGDPKKST